MTIPPTMQPRDAIMSGSMSERQAVVAVDTSSS